MDKAGIFGIKMIIAGHEWFLKNRTVFLMQETATVFTKYYRYRATSFTKERKLMNIWVLALLTWKQSSFSGRLLFLSSVCLSVNASHVHLLLPNHQANFNLTSHKESLVKGIQICSNKGPRLSPWRHDSKIAKMH